jgi:hypothetical protein
MSQDQPEASARRGLSRRRLITASAIAAATVVPVGVALGRSGTASANVVPGDLVDRRFAGPVDRAFGYLNFVMDAYKTGTALRLLQSYNNESGLLTTAFVYDNALAVIAYLSRPSKANVARAKVIGDTFLWIQANDERFTDGRVRQAYAAGPMLFYGGGPFFPGVVRDDGKSAFLWPFGFSGSAVGDVAWTGLALAHLYAHTREKKYLDGAVALGTWIVTTSTSPYALGGYLGGVQGDGVTEQPWASTEHNIDSYGLFRLLARFTGDASWSAKAAVARDFVHKMYNPAGGYFWTGTQAASPNDINKDILPEDVNTWSFLSLGERAYAGSIDWAATNLATADIGGTSANSQVPSGVTVSGVTFSDLSKKLTGPVPNGGGRNNDQSAVWLEGNGHLAAALLARDDRHRTGGNDCDRARSYLQQVVTAQDRLGGGQTVGLTSDPNGGRLFDPGEGGTWTGSPLPARSGVVAASSAFDTGFGFGYFQNQHVGATSWFIIAALGLNPYHA